MIHQVLVEGMVGLQSSNECGCSDIITTVINQYHLALEITDVALEGLSLLHLDGEEVVVIILNSCRETYWLNKASLTSSKLRRDRDGRK